jgi:hypothetical protein
MYHSKRLEILKHFKLGTSGVFVAAFVKSTTSDCSLDNGKTTFSRAKRFSLASFHYVCIVGW